MRSDKPLPPPKPKKSPEEPLKVTITSFNKTDFLDTPESVVAYVTEVVSQWAGERCDEYDPTCRNCRVYEKLDALIKDIER